MSDPTGCNGYYCTDRSCERCRPAKTPATKAWAANPARLKRVRCQEQAPTSETIGKVVVRQCRLNLGHFEACEGSPFHRDCTCGWEASVYVKSVDTWMCAACWNRDYPLFGDTKEWEATQPNYLPREDRRSALREEQEGKVPASLQADTDWSPSNREWFKDLPESWRAPKRETASQTPDSPLSLSSPPVRASGERRLIHDDGCGVELWPSGYCPKCGFAPDMQSTAIVNASPRNSSLASSLPAPAPSPAVPNDAVNNPKMAQPSHEVSPQPGLTLDDCATRINKGVQVPTSQGTPPNPGAHPTYRGPSPSMPAECAACTTPHGICWYERECALCDACETARGQRARWRAWA